MKCAYPLSSAKEQFSAGPEGCTPQSALLTAPLKGSLTKADKHIMKNKYQTKILRRHPNWRGPPKITLFPRSRIKATPHNEARRFGERFWHKRKYEKCGNTGCIFHFSYCALGAKDPPKPAVPIVRCCLNSFFTIIPLIMPCENGRLALVCCSFLNG